MLLFLAAFITVAVLAPAIEYIVVIPPAMRRMLTVRRWLLDTLCSLVGYGGWLALTGSTAMAAIMTLVLMIVTAMASNTKYRILGEPLLFSDVIVARSFLQNPKFYLFSIPVVARITIIPLCLALPAVLWISASATLVPHLAGVVMLASGCLLLRCCPSRRWAPAPDISHDLSHLGLPGSILLYWRQWRASTNLPPPAILQGKPAHDLIIIVQCESFTDPGTLNLPENVSIPPMPGLTLAYKLACHRGPLYVSGFGAYTMRCEYGVIFGQEETNLGFRRYDPFLTARREYRHALGLRLKNIGYDSTFVHPHDLRFYDRETLMPVLGFSRLVQPGPYLPTPAMPYFGDIPLGQKLIGIIRSVSAPSLFYTVTMENHGPWPQGKDKQAPLQHYLRHLRNSDQMLMDLITELSSQDRKALLIFFGDHRPSIPGIVTPTDQRDVPYVVISFPCTGNTPPQPPVARTPAQLNSLITRMAVRQ